jgi:hypothetical protein
MSPEVWDLPESTGGLTRPSLRALNGRGAAAAFVMYIPMFGMALGAASLLVMLRDSAARCLKISRKPEPVGEPVRLVCWVAIASGLMLLYNMYGIDALRPLIAEQENLRAATSDLRQLRKTLRPGADVLLVNDPLPSESWDCLWLFRLLYRDPRIWVERRRDLVNANAMDLSLYDYVFENRSGQYYEVPSLPRAQREPVKVVFTPSRVRQGQPYTVSIEEYSGSAVDVAFWVVRKTPISGGVKRNWCTLDGSGRARLVTPVDAPVGTIMLTKARRAGADWRAAEGALEVIRR